MSLTPEENKNTEKEIELSEESTIFGVSPTLSQEPKKKVKNKMLKTALSLFLALVVLAGVTVAVIKLVPERKEDEAPITEEVSVIALAEQDVKNVTINRTESSSLYVTKVTDTTSSSGESTKTVAWSIDGIDATLTDSSSISSLMKSVLELKATRKIEKEADANYGFSNPFYTVEIKGYDEAKDKKLVIGSMTPSSSGYYATVDGGDTVYLLTKDTVDKIGTPDTELSIKKVVTPPSADKYPEKYFLEGELIYFDKAVLSRKGSTTIELVSNFDEETADFVPYIITSPVRRAADSEAALDIVDVVSSGLAATGAYAYYPTAKDLQMYGLKSPEIVLDFAFDSERIVINMTKQPDGNYAVMVKGNDNIIFKVSSDAAKFAQTTLDDYMNSMPFFEMLSYFDRITCATEENTTVFDISYVKTTQEGDEDISEVIANGASINVDMFKNYYQYIVGIETNEDSYEKMSGTPAFTIKAKYRNSNDSVSLVFIKQTDRRYYFEIDGTPIGFVSTTYVNKLMEYYQTIAKGEEIPEY